MIKTWMIPLNSEVGIKPAKGTLHKEEVELKGQDESKTRGAKRTHGGKGTKS